MQPKSIFTRKSIGGITALCAVLGLSGCATWKDSVQSQLNNAKSVITTAKSAGAERYAPDTIKSADNYVAQAQQMISLGKFEAASRSAQRALADAQLAKAQADSGKSTAEVQALRKEIASLTQ